MKDKKYLKLLFYLLLGVLEYDFSLKRFRAVRYKRLFPEDWVKQQIEILQQLKREINRIF
ncbi:MAG: hypothetical protein DRJ03_08065 [Chloroflexi bacterium]|nr:MAG: hypothetical protein DRJ03_08065 [Chloroflexota bacterium]